MFDEEFYLSLVNGAFKNALTKPVKMEDLNSNLLGINKKLEEYFKTHSLKNNQSFNHFRPAKYFLDTVDTDNMLSDDTLDCFEKLFEALNQILS